MNRILIAEDEDNLRRNLAFILSSLGYEVQAARNTREAMDVLQRHEFDLLLTDLVMPEKGGGELIDNVLKTHPDMKIIIMTAYPSIDSAINAVKSGVIDYYTKPFKTEEIISAIGRAMKTPVTSEYNWHALNQYKLTHRELEILRAIVEEGLNEAAKLSEHFGIKQTTVKQHLENLYAKFAVRNKAALITEVIRALHK